MNLHPDVHETADLQQAKKLCRQITKIVSQLQEKRDMSINECKLTIAIEDPRARERREAMGIEVCFFRLHISMCPHRNLSRSCCASTQQCCMSETVDMHLCVVQIAKA